jgi:hypothetical protein
MFQDEIGSACRFAITKQEDLASPRMRVDNLNVAGVTWSNFEPGVFPHININGSIAIVYSLLVDPVNMGADVNVAVAMLSAR